jgi:hypothetical protein
VNLPIIIRRAAGSDTGYMVLHLSPLWRADIPQVLTALRVMLESRIGRPA